MGHSIPFTIVPEDTTAGEEHPDANKAASLTAMASATRGEGAKICPIEMD
ncbi:hypothetical protein SESBI_20507 [Sesbania bispinosa]|nr:hypothetical protein SESBI_20507 [Sesbania bispinosa]